MTDCRRSECSIGWGSPGSVDTLGAMKTTSSARRLVISVCIPVMLMSAAEAQHIKSPEVHDDGRVTVRIRSANAAKITTSIHGQKLELIKGDNDLWSGTTKPLPPGIYDYTFDVDGTKVIDPSNRRVKKWASLASMVEVPGDPPLLTEFCDVPHGVVHRAIYNSTSVGHTRPVMIYTPPGYGSSPERFPVVLLLHGFGDDETAWTEVGRAHLIADNLIAQNRIRPCVIAMPYGHPIPFPYGQRPDNYFPDNADLYTLDLMQDLLPYLRQNYLVVTDASNLSVAGLSMGGGHAIDTGLKSPSAFSAVGAFSAAAPQLDNSELVRKYNSLGGAEPAANQLQTFWIPIGKDDFLLDRNDRFAAQLKSLGVQHVYEQTDGGHAWNVWREYLPKFLEKAVGARQP